MRRVRPVVAVLVAVGLLAGCTGKDAVDSSGTSEFRFVQNTAAGKVIPVAQRKDAGDVTGTLLSGGTYSLSQDAGKPVVLNWFASWCGPCQTETPGFAALYKQVRGGTEFVGIDAKDEKSKGSAFVQANDVTYPVLYDFDVKSALQIGKSVPVSSLPYTVIVDKHQKVAAFYLGAVQPADLTSALTQLAGES